MADATWDTIDGIVDWLDRESPAPEETARMMRILKLQEEVGEAAQAVIGAVGYNPRKGQSHTWDDVEKELCDVILTAMVALRTITPEAGKIFAHHLERVGARSVGRAETQHAHESDDAPAVAK
ncbi:MazG-like family protein [Streptomyces sp. NPDC048696]|uniref:MazG-like family protein n=1 Tax=Streptomyces sp. NPDC048696 TaxID=3365585 RepID=UPI00371C566F